MNNIVIWGSGQGGRMVKKLIKSDSSVTAFCDNKESLWGTEVEGTPVINPKKLMEIKPDYICISVLNQEASVSIQEQIEEMGLSSSVISISEIRKVFDIRLATLRLIATEIRKRNTKGALAELGVYKGEFSAEINRLFPDRKLYLFDTFEGFDQRDLESEKKYSKQNNDMFKNTCIEKVYKLMPYPDNVIIKKGYFPETSIGVEEKFALVSLDADLYKPMYAGLNYFYGRMSKGGFILLHDYNSLQFPGAGEATNQFCIENDTFVVPLSDFHGSGVIIKA